MPECLPVSPSSEFCGQFVRDLSEGAGALLTGRFPYAARWQDVAGGPQTQFGQGGHYTIQLGDGVGFAAVGGYRGGVVVRGTEMVSLGRLEVKSQYFKVLPGIPVQTPPTAVVGGSATQSGIPHTDAS